MFKFLVLLATLAVAAADIFPMHESRIVGGKPTTIEKYPHQVSLETLKNVHFCGASIYTERYIITAAHCLIEKSADQYRVRVGTSHHGSAGKLFAVEKHVYHPDFSSKNSDVAIIKLKGKITFGPRAQPIRLTSTEPRQGEILTVTGWGLSKTSDEQFPSVLQAVLVPSIDRGLCRFTYGEMFTEAMICAGVAGKDACQGDSGGPLINDKRELVGIVSFGTVKGCGVQGYPGLYTNVASDSVRRFIIGNTRE